MALRCALEIQPVAVGAPGCLDLQPGLQGAGAPQGGLALHREPWGAGKGRLEMHLLDRHAAEANPQRRPAPGRAVAAGRGQSVQGQCPGGQGPDGDLGPGQESRVEIQGRLLDHQPGALPVSQLQPLQPGGPGPVPAQALKHDLAVGELLYAPAQEPLPRLRGRREEEGRGDQHHQPEDQGQLAAEVQERLSQDLEHDQKACPRPM